MKKIKILFSLLIFQISICVYAQNFLAESGNTHILTKEQIEVLLKKPLCLKGYWPNQTGPLRRLDLPEGSPADSTFTVEKIKIPSDGLIINGWLYLPLGNKIHPLVILTNGGGDDSRPIRNFSDWLAPILAHCGIAAFVHDKRGTGESEGVFVKTTYDDYVTDAGNCAKFLLNHSRIDSSNIGVIGGSEGGRIALLTASRYSEIKFVVSFAGTVVSAVDDRINAQKGWLQSLNLADTTFLEVLRLHEKSIRAWASNDLHEHIKVNEEIELMREKYDAEILPFTKQEMDSIPDFIPFLSTWYSLTNDYLTELEHFNKKWLAIFGEVDQVVPTQKSVENILHYMSISRNVDYQILVLPNCGHSPVNIETKRMIRLDNLIINWMNKNIINKL
ncbi:MAG: alpha/beta hydrolase [Bacteroidales bacterium]|nr:alpha/beta hydrolase [Bacteroidales bacterium]